MVVDSHRKQLFRPFLTYYILVEIVMYLFGLEQLLNLAMLRGVCKSCFMDIFIAPLHTIYADT
jgi:hypothetical protein